MSVLISRDVVREPLYAIVPYQNPWRYKSRVKHTERALKHFHESGVTIVLVEIAFNRREFELDDIGIDGVSTNCSNILKQDSRFKHRHIKLRTNSELWLKENAINIGVQSLPRDWEQVCWLDSDVHFLRPNWVGECIHKLQHYSFLQMFSHARDLGPNYEMLPEDYHHANGIGFVHAWKEGKIKSDHGIDQSVIKQDLFNIKRDLAQLTADVLKLEHDLADYYGAVGPIRVFPGLAWACTRQAWEDVGGLMDEAIWGGQDWHLSHSLIGKREGMMWAGLHRNYQKLVMQWYHRCESKIRRNVGVMEGSITHHWHGRKSNRGYNAKHALLSRIGFDPPRHLRRDSNGLWNLYDDGSNEFLALRDMFRKIAKDRNEDSPEI